MSHLIGIFGRTGSAWEGKNTCFFDIKFRKAKNYVFLSQNLTPKTAFFRDPPHFFLISTKETLPPPVAGDGWRGRRGCGLAGWLGWLGWWAGWVGWVYGVRCTVYGIS